MDAEAQLINYQKWPQQASNLKIHWQKQGKRHFTVQSGVLFTLLVNTRSQTAHLQLLLVSNPSMGGMCVLLRSHSVCSAGAADGTETLAEFFGPTKTTLNVLEAALHHAVLAGIRNLSASRAQEWMQISTDLLDSLRWEARSFSDELLEPVLENQTSTSANK